MAKPDLFGMAKNELIAECTGLVRAAHFTKQVMEDANVCVLTD